MRCILFLNTHVLIFIEYSLICQRKRIRVYYVSTVFYFTIAWFDSVDMLALGRFTTLFNCIVVVFSSSSWIESLCIWFWSCCFNVSYVWDRTAVLWFCSEIWPLSECPPIHIWLTEKVFWMLQLLVPFHAISNDSRMPNFEVIEENRSCHKKDKLLMIKPDDFSTIIRTAFA